MPALSTGMITWHHLFTMFAPWSVPHDQRQFLVLDEFCEIFGRQWNNSTWRWFPVRIVHFLHVGDDTGGISFARIVLNFGTFSEHGQRWESLDHVFFS